MAPLIESPLRSRVHFHKKKNCGIKIICFTKMQTSEKGYMIICIKAGISQEHLRNKAKDL